MVVVVVVVAVEGIGYEGEEREILHDVGGRGRRGHGGSWENVGNKGRVSDC